MNSQRSAPLSRATAERSSFHEVAPSFPRTSVIERARGGTGGLSVSSGEPPAHAVVGTIPLPGTLSGRIAGSEVRAIRNEEARATLAKRGRNAISASPFRRSRRGIASTHAIPLRRRGKGGRPAPPSHDHKDIRRRNAPTMASGQFFSFGPKILKSPSRRVTPVRSRCSRTGMEYFRDTCNRFLKSPMVRLLLAAR